MLNYITTTVQDKTFAKFIAVGLLNTLFGYSVFALLLFIGLHYAIATLVATVLGVLFNFKTIGTLVFKNSNNILIIKFVGVYTITYFLNIVLLKILSTWSINMYLAGFLLLAPMAMLAYLLNRHFVFNENP